MTISTNSSNRSQFQGASPHIVHGALSSWVLEPAGELDRIADGEKLTPEIARHLTVDVDAAMRRHCPGAKRFYFVHDYTGVAAYDWEAVEMLISWGARSMREVAAIVLVVSPTVAPDIRAAAEQGQKQLGLLGVEMSISTDLHEVVRRYGLRPAVINQGT